MSGGKKRQRPKKLDTDQMDKQFNLSDYSEYLGKNGRRASVWNYFLRRNDGYKAKCKLCKKKDSPVLIPTTDNNTSGLKSHLKKVHTRLGMTNSEEEEYSQPVNEVTQGPTKKCSKKVGAQITDYMKPLKEDNLESLVAELAAKDGVPFDTISRSQPLRKLFSKSRYGQLPLSHNTVRETVMRYGEKIKAQTIEKIQELKKDGERFSLTLDEWTSKNNKQYLNINVHYRNSQCINLGLARIKDSFNSQDCLELMKGRLSDFGLNLQVDIVASTNDGASVMQKYGVLSGITNQKCMAHGIQLAVVDVFYEKTIFPGSQNDEPSGDSNEFDEDSGPEDEEFDGDSTSVSIVPNSESIGFKDVKVKNVIEKIRKIVRLFRKSPLKNSVLQKQILADKDEVQRRRKVKLQAGLQLILDCKVRWTSLYDMSKRYYDVQSSVEKTLIELKSDKRYKAKLSKIETLTDEEKDVLEDLVETLGVG